MIESATSKELAVSLCTFKTSEVSITILPARMSNAEPEGTGKSFPMYILSPSAFSIFASIVIEIAVVLAIVHPITTVVVD